MYIIRYVYYTQSICLFLHTSDNQFVMFWQAKLAVIFPVISEKKTKFISEINQG